MDRLNRTINNISYILDCLIALKNIHESGSCNDCKLGHMRTTEWQCEYKPELGQIVRYNCPFYIKEKGE